MDIDELWEEMLSELREAVPCPASECPTCEYSGLCEYVRACLAESETE